MGFRASNLYPQSPRHAAAAARMQTLLAEKILTAVGTTHVAAHFITVTTETPLPSKRW